MHHDHAVDYVLSVHTGHRRTIVVLNNSRLKIQLICLGLDKWHISSQLFQMNITNVTNIQSPTVWTLIQRRVKRAQSDLRPHWSHTLFLSTERVKGYKYIHIHQYNYIIFSDTVHIYTKLCWKPNISTLSTDLKKGLFDQCVA